MSAQQPQTMARSVGAELSFSSGSMPEAILRRLVGDLECGELVIETPAGKRLLLKGRQFGPQARLQIHSWRLLGRLLSGWDVGFAEAYIAGECSSPNLDALLTLASQNSALAEPLKTLRMPRIWPRLCHAMNRNTRRGSRRNISAHYDLGNQFYEQWLDAGMQYSAALFSAPDQTLENAQDVKLDRVTSLLDLAGGESILEIGCGWGALAQRLLKTHDGRITGITLSKEQLAYAQRRLAAESSANRCDLRLQDYRDLRGTFDRIVSIEMLEAVGEAYWPTYFEKLRTCLRTGGTPVATDTTPPGDRRRRSRTYVERLSAPFADRIRLDAEVREVRRMSDGVIVTDLSGHSERFDHAVMASHADQALAALADPSGEERDLLGAFRYGRNHAVLHTDESFMPKRRSVWSSWNYTGTRDAVSDSVCVTYWMNRLQNIESDKPIFVTLNPPRPPRAGTLLHSEVYDHPIFDAKAIIAQRKLWLLQGSRNTWFCGSYFGAGFHEDGLQAGLAVAEQLGGLRRPWQVPNESGRIVLTARTTEANSELLS